MIIGIDASRANEAQKTGVGWYAWHIITELKAILPADVQVVLYSRKPLSGELAQLPDNWTSKILGWPPKRFWTQIRMSWEMLISKPDVLFIPAHVFPFVHPKKTVMTVHDMAASVFPEAYSRFECWYSLWSARRARKRLWKIIVPTDFVKESVEKEAPSGKAKVFTVHHGYDEAFGIPAKETERVLNTYHIRQPYILSIGRLEEKKNTRRLVEAFSNMHGEAQLVLVGKPGHGGEAVQCAIERSAQKDKIKRLGFVEQQDLRALMQCARLFAFPSLYEGFGIPVLEAFAAKTPVVTASGSSLEEVGGDAALYIDPKNTDELQQALEQMLTNKEKRDACIKQGSKRVEEFSWKKAAEQTADILTHPL